MIAQQQVNKHMIKLTERTVACNHLGNQILEQSEYDPAKCFWRFGYITASSNRVITNQVN